MIASQIYSYARSKMFTEVFMKSIIFDSPVYYSDTDSAIIGRKLYDHLVQINLIYTPSVHGALKIFGLYELECKIAKLTVVSPKFYLAETYMNSASKGKIPDKDIKLKPRFKGISMRDSFENANGEFIPIIENEREFFTLRMEHKVRVKTWRFERTQAIHVRHVDMIKLI